MHPAIEYLLKMLLCSAILLGYYWMALRNERFHQWNRFYLLAAMFLSVVVPFIHIPMLVQEEPTVIITMVSALPWNQQVVVTPIFWTWKNLLLFATAIVSCLLLIQLLAGILRMVLLYKSQPHSFFKEVNVVITDEKSAPFSFFKWLFWRSDIDLDSEQGQHILQHELTHITEKHSADKLLTELLLIVFWMNPFFWLMRKELFAIHEFLADRKAIANRDGAAFAAMILQAVQHEPTPALANPFFSSHLKRRLIMITHSTAPKYSYLRRISGLLLMIFTGISLVLSIENAMAQKAPPPPPKKQVAPPPPPAYPPDQLPDSIKAAEVITIKGKPYIKYTMKDGRKFTYELNQAYKKGYYIPPPPPPTPKAPGVSGTSEPTQKTVSVVLSDTALPVRLTLSKNDDHQPPPIIILDGKEIPYEQLQQIRPELIASINVLKGAASISQYGEKGKGGVIQIQSKTDNTLQLQGVPVAGQTNATNNKQGEVVVVGFSTKKAETNDNLFTEAEVMPEFPGGPDAWRRYLERNLNYPEAARKNGTQGSVTVQFVVDKSGNISNVVALNDPGNGLAEEALRIIKKGPKWTPAEQNGRKVVARTEQTITFRLD